MGRKRREPRTCPRCGIIHQLRGPYCSQSCGNVREYTPELRQQRSNAARAYMQANPDVAHNLQNIRQLQQSSNGDIRTFDDWMVVPPLDDDDELADWDVNSY